VQDIGIKTWSFYRYSLTKEYHDKPTLAPPFIIVNHLWRIILYIYKKCGNKWEQEDDFGRFYSISFLRIDLYFVKTF